MKNFKEIFEKKDRRSVIQKEIDRLENEMEGMDPSMDAYKSRLEALKALRELRASDKKKPMNLEWLKAVMPALLSAGVSFLEVYMILNFEEEGKFFGTKAMSFLKKP